MSARREIVEAGAGCGKTYSIVSRYIEALGIDPDENGKGKSIKGKDAFSVSKILSLTFTDAAAKQMKERIIERLEHIGRKDIAEEVQRYGKIQTFHSYCFSLYKEHVHSEAKLLLPQEATHLKKSHVINTLNDEQLEQLFQQSELGNFLKICIDLWGQDIGNKASQTKKKLLDFKKLFEVQIQELRQELQVAIDTNFDEEKKKGEAWTHCALELLQSNKIEEFVNLNLRKKSPSKIDKNHPVLYAGIKQLKELMKKGHFSLLNSELIEAEENQQRNFLKLIESFTKNAPLVLDFNQLEKESFQLLEDNDIHHDLIIVDEFQDTNEEQFKIIERLSSEKTEWYFVGDPKQSIYSFRGADANFYTSIREKLQCIELKKNWRSHPQLIHCFNEIQEELFLSHSTYDPQAQKLEAAKSNDEWPEDATLDIFHYSDKKLAEGKLIEKIQSSSSKEIFILFRRWKNLYNCSELLLNNNLDFEIVGTENPWTHPLHAIFVELLEGIHDFESQGWKNFLQWCQLDRQQLFSGELSEDEKNWKELSIDKIFLKFTMKIQAHRWKESFHWLQSMTSLLQKWTNNDFHFNYSLDELCQFLRQTQLLESSSQLKASTQARVKLLTIHQSKGLEAEEVILFDAYAQNYFKAAQSLDNEEFTVQFRFHHEDPRYKNYSSLYYQYLKRIESLTQEAEEKRLHYVAFSRAASKLSVFLPIEKSSPPKIDPYDFIEFPEIRRSYWNHAWKKIIEKKLYTHYELLEESPHDEKNPSPNEEIFLVPTPLEKEPSLAFYGGITEFLARNAPNNYLESSSATPFQNTNFTQLGTTLHQVIEKWSGKKEDMAPLTQNLGEKDLIEEALKKMREDEDLNFYWQALASQDFKVFHEFNIVLPQGKDELNGSIDVLICGKDEWIILDWKSSSSLQRLQEEKRIEKIKAQLKLYAESFNNFPHPPLKIVSYGLQLQEKDVKTKLLFKEEYRAP